MLSSVYDTPVREWEIDCSEIDITETQMLGEGFFGKVFKARWKEMQVLYTVLVVICLMYSTSS